MSRLTDKEFKDRANNIWKNYYKYPEKYTKGRQLISIECPIDGVFQIYAEKHIAKKNPRGCPKCGIRKRGENKRLTNEQFIERCKKKHKDEYGYDACIYFTSHELVLIRCGIHGLFSQIAWNHLSGSGCPKCGMIKYAHKRMKQNDIFLLEAKKIHGDKYGYPEEYKGCKNKIRIYCKKCDKEFSQTPDGHINGKKGCIDCGCILSGTKQSYTLQEVVKKSQEIHSVNGIAIYKYDENKDYKSNRDMLKINCKHHGIFEQVVYSHLLGRGCPCCTLFKTEEMVRKMLSKILPNNKPFIKIRPKFLERMEIDCYNDDLKLAVEVNGKQHYSFVSYFHKTIDGFESQKTRDIKKKKLCLEHKINFLEVPYIYNCYNPEKLKDFLISELMRLEYIIEI